MWRAGFDTYRGSLDRLPSLVEAVSLVPEPSVAEEVIGEPSPLAVFGFAGVSGVTASPPAD
jgi:hypothetical protein